MPLDLILKTKVSDSVWIAIGSFSGENKKKEKISGPAEILLKETGKNELTPILDSSLKESRIMNQLVKSYTNATPIAVTKIKAGAAVHIEKLWISTLRQS
jgi:hypothetical protein